MSDVVKVNETHRYIEALFSDTSAISSCKFYLLTPASTTEQALTGTSFSESRDGVTVYGFHYQIDDEITVEGWYSYEVYIEMTDGYKGRREGKRFFVYGNQKYLEA